MHSEKQAEVLGLKLAFTNCVAKSKWGKFKDQTMATVPAHEEELSVVHLESDDENLFLLHRSGQRCRSHSEGVAVWTRTAGLISDCDCQLTLAAWTLANSLV